MDILEILLGQIPEAIYFALFMIFVKELKSKRIIFIILMIIEYILLLNVFPYSTWSHVLYFILSFIIMKVLYKDKCNITDVFTLGIASIILMLISISISLLFRNSITLAIIISRLLMFTFILCINYKLNNIQKLYKHLWNRPKVQTFMKSATFRAINTIVFNLMFYIINICMLYALIFKK